MAAPIEPLMRFKLFQCKNHPWFRAFHLDISGEPFEAVGGRSSNSLPACDELIRKARWVRGVKQSPIRCNSFLTEIGTLVGVESMARSWVTFIFPFAPYSSELNPGQCWFNGKGRLETFYFFQCPDHREKRFASRYLRIRPKSCYISTQYLLDETLQPEPGPRPCGRELRLVGVLECPEDFALSWANPRHFAVPPGYTLE